MLHIIAHDGGGNAMNAGHIIAIISTAAAAKTQTGRPKDWEHIHAAILKEMDKHGAEPDGTVVIGNTASACTAAKAAGVAYRHA